MTKISAEKHRRAVDELRKANIENIVLRAGVEQLRAEVARLQAIVDQLDEISLL